MVFEIFAADRGVTGSDGIFHSSTSRSSKTELQRITVEIGGETLATIHGDPVIDPQQPDRVRIRSPATQRLAVHVVDAAGLPQADVSLECVHVAPLESDPRINVLGRPERTTAGPTDEHGATGVELELGTWHLDIIDPFLAPGGLTVTLSEAGSELTVVVRMVDESTATRAGEHIPQLPVLRHLRGRVIAAVDGAPLRAALITSNGWFPNFRQARFHALADGWFDIEHRATKSFYLAAASEGHATTFLGPLEPTDSGPFDIVMRPARRITGRVVDDLGDPVASTVFLYHSSDRFQRPGETPAPRPQRKWSWRYTTQEDGTFHFDDVTAAVHRIRVEPKDHALPPALIDVTGGDADVVVTLGHGLDGLGTLRGRVLDAATGHTIPDAWVTLHAWSNPFGRGPSVTSGADGTFVFHGVAPGHYTVSAASTPYSGQHYAHRQIGDVEVLAGETRLDIALWPTRQLFLVVVDAAGDPVVDAHVRAVTPDGHFVVFTSPAGSFGGGLTFLLTDRAGRITLNGLPAQPVTLRTWRDKTSFRVRRSIPDTSRDIDLTTPVTDRIEIRFPR